MSASTPHSSSRAGAQPPTPQAPAAPRSPETPAPGQAPRRINDALAAEIKQYHYEPGMRPEDRKPTKSKADYGVVHPDLPGIRTRPNDADTHEKVEGHVFADFTRDARLSTHRLMEGGTGHSMMTDLNASAGRLNPGAQATPKVPLTSVDIRPGNSMYQRPRRDVSPALTHAVNSSVPGSAQEAEAIRQYRAEAMASARKAYRTNGQQGPGAASEVSYDHRPQPGSMEGEGMQRDRARSLGHEMTHAWRGSNGLQVTNPNTAGLGSHPVFDNTEQAKPGAGKKLREDMAWHSLMKEELETVGLEPTPNHPNAPSENKIRPELGIMEPRKDYSHKKSTPQTNAELLAAMKQPPDTRGPMDRLRGRPIPGADEHAEHVQMMVDHLEK